LTFKLQFHIFSSFLLLQQNFQVPLNFSAMEKVPLKSIQKISGICLMMLIFIILYSDKLNMQRTSRRNVETDSRLLDRKSVSVLQIPDYFEINMGQANGSVKFISRGKSHTLFLTPSGALISLAAARGKPERIYPAVKNQMPALEYQWLSILMEGSNPKPEIEGIHELAGRSNYLIGNDPARWKKNVPHYEMVKYSQVYNGIDLVYHNRRNNLEYDFIVSPGTDPGQIRFNITGAEIIKEDESGNLLLHTRLGDMIIKAPETYQQVHGVKMVIASKYEIDKRGGISIRLDPYDKSKPLIIDPEMVYSTYLGGSNTEGGYGIDADNEGNVYVIGSTKSTDFPGANGSPSLAGETDVFITKLNPQTSELIFTTFLGGSSSENGLHIGIDDSKNICAAGWTCSGNFPVKNSIQKELGDAEAGIYDYGDIFACKLDPTGSSLVYSTYLGGREKEELYDAVFDTEGNAYLSGNTDSYLDAQQEICTNDFPLYPKKYQNYPDPCFNKQFVTKINGNGQLIFSTLFESTTAMANCLAVNKTGNACLLRWSHEWKPDFSPPWNLVTIIKLNDSGTGIVDSVSFLMSSQNIWTWINDFQLDDKENIFIAGSTNGEMDPVTSDAYQSTYNYEDGFLFKLNQDASEFLYATYLGGSMFDDADRIQIDKNGYILIYGYTASEDFPLRNAYQSEYGGGGDIFLAMIDPSKKGTSSLVFATYLGGESTDIDRDFTLDANEIIYLTGYTWSTKFPVENPLISTLQGTTSAFITVFTQNNPIDLIYDEVVISGPPVFTTLLPPNTQQVLPQYLIRNVQDTVIFRFEGRSTDGRVGLRVTNTFVDMEPRLVLDMSVIDPEQVEIPTWTIFNMGEGNRGVQFDVTKNGFYIVKVWAEPLSGPFPAPFQIHLAGNVGWPRPLLYPIPDPPTLGYPDTIRATRQDILINASAPRPQLLRGNLGDVQFNPTSQVSQTSLFKFTNIFQVSEHAVAVLTPFNKMGFEQGRAPVRMLDPNPMYDITTPTAPFNNTVFFPGGGYVVDFTQVPIPAAINVPVQLRQAAVLGKEDGIAAELPVIIPYRNNRLITIPTIILDMGSGQEIVDGEGNDFKVISPEGNYSVAVSNTVFANTFVPIGEIVAGDQEFDLNGTSLQSARYVRIIAESTASIDAVRALNYFCDEIRNDLGPVSKVSYVTLTDRRSKAPQTIFDPFMELIGPDGALNATNESGFGDDLSLNSSDAALINMELNQEGFYRYLGRGHDKTPNEESFGFFYTRYESGGSYDPIEINISESALTEITAQRKVKITSKRQRDSYLFQAAPNQIINIAAYSSEIDVILELYDPEEFLIAACDNHPGWGTDALISVQLPDSSFVGQAPLPALNTYRIVVSAIDHPGDLKNTQAGNAYLRQPANGEYELKVNTSDELLDINDRESKNYPYLYNYPNPFSQYTIISYELKASAHVEMEIFDLKGKMIIPLINELQPAGSQTVYWQGNDWSGCQVPNGVYICRIKAGKFTCSKKMILNR
jgi:hypothetical protein